MRGEEKDAEERIAEKVVLALIEKGAIDDRRDVEVRVFSPVLGATEIKIRFPDPETS